MFSSNVKNYITKALYQFLNNSMKSFLFQPLDDLMMLWDKI